MAAGPTDRRIAAGVVVANLAAWAAAGASFGGDPALVAAALLAWGLGLRHALDPDHLAVIDNAVRASIGPSGRSPGAGSGWAPGLWFALGHSTIVVAACAAANWVAAGGRVDIVPWRRAGETAGPFLSSGLLLAVAGLNVISAAASWRRSAPDAAVAVGNPLGRLLRPVRARIAAGGSMYPMGLVMGLGFDTASEIALLALSAAQAARHLPWIALLVFPVLFAAGMSAVDAGNGWLMRRAYRWAAHDPARRQRCNLVLTAASAAAAIGIAGWQLCDAWDGRSARHELRQPAPAAVASRPATVLDAAWAGAPPPLG